MKINFIQSILFQYYRNEISQQKKNMTELLRYLLLKQLCHVNYVMLSKTIEI